MIRIQWHLCSQPKVSHPKTERKTIKEIEEKSLIHKINLREEQEKKGNIKNTRDFGMTCTMEL